MEQHLVLAIQRSKNTHRIHPARHLAIHTRGIRQPKAPPSLNELLAQAGEGDTSLERIVEAAANERNIYFDDRQFYLDLGTGAEYTILDFVIFSPPTAIYVDGIQHEIRPDVKARDQQHDFWLESMGWNVIHLKQDKILADPLGYVSSMLIGVMF